ncbi:methyltransferase-like protein 27 [Ylistrum balloti]|uniref:methyltransferase-like protein 27 n=1 Tax=Ylistrum balloti TaxID=509963 RepID=UPI002905875A|nr:methyltransferase-like protein 27 [Ylistrum balloti]
MVDYYNDKDGVFADNISDRERIGRYSLVSPSYEQEVKENGYTAPYVCAGVIGEVYPDQRHTISILDIAAGTGLVALELKKLGFLTMDAIEPSEGMLELAAKKGLYRNLYNTVLSADPLPLPSDAYDAVTICGWHGNVNSLTDSLLEIIRVIKPGGYICIVTRMIFIQNLDDYKALLQQCVNLEEANKWKRVELTGFQGYLNNIEGVKLVFVVF